MSLPRYVLASNRQELPAPVIISTVAPYHIGKIWTFTDAQKYLDHINHGNFMAYYVVPGYKVVITYDGTLAGRSVEVFPGLRESLAGILEEMGNFYYAERIEAKPGWSNKFLL